MDCVPIIGPRTLVMRLLARVRVPGLEGPEAGATDVLNCRMDILRVTLGIPREIHLSVDNGADQYALLFYPGLDF